MFADAVEEFAVSIIIYPEDGTFLLNVYHTTRRDTFSIFRVEYATLNTDTVITFLVNVGKHQPVYMASHRKIQQCSVRRHAICDEDDFIAGKQLH
jgi:hypothetical protein